MEIYVGWSARPGEPTRWQHRRRRVSGWWQAAVSPLIRRWMSKPRVTRLFGLRIAVPVGVFPPRWFFSTKLVCRAVRQLPLQDQTFLEVGCGSGTISLVAAKGGADVTAIDISSLACTTTRENAAANGLTVRVLESDLFAAVEGTFDVVVVTPPFFRQDPATQLDHAFHAGANFEYFHRLFDQLPAHLHDDSLVLLSLAEGCDAAIGEIARERGFDLQIHRRWMVMLQFTYVFRMVRR
jgi:release factor glutamine methyltransferase